MNQRLDELASGQTETNARLDELAAQSKQLTAEQAATKYQLELLTDVTKGLAAGQVVTNERLDRLAETVEASNPRLDRLIEVTTRSYTDWAGRYDSHEARIGSVEQRLDELEKRT